MAVKITDNLGSDAILVISASGGFINKSRALRKSVDSSGISGYVLIAARLYIPRMIPFSFERPEKNSQTVQT